MKKIRLELPIPDYIDPSEILEELSGWALDLWEEYFDAHPEQADELHTFVTNEVSVEEIDVGG